jgi:hypothetical protein
MSRHPAFAAPLSRIRCAAILRLLRRQDSGARRYFVPLCPRITLSDVRKYWQISVTLSRTKLERNRAGGFETPLSFEIPQSFLRREF